MEAVHVTSRNGARLHESGAVGARKVSTCARTSRWGLALGLARPTGQTLRQELAAGNRPARTPREGRTLLRRASTTRPVRPAASPDSEALNSA